MTKRLMVLLAVFACMAFLFACADDKTPATTAVTAAEDAVKTINKDDAMKYAADKYAAIEKELAAAKDSMGKKDYKAALASAKDIPAKVPGVIQAIAEGKKAELAKTWEEASAGLPALFDQIQNRINVLSKSKAKKSAADAAKSGLSDVKKLWADAQEMYKAGKMKEAGDALKSIKAKTSELLTSLGMPVPDALK